jgi:hypothetical protein
VCGPLRAAVQDEIEKHGFNLARGPAGADVALSADVSIASEQSQQQFGNTFVVRTYSVDFNGDSPRFNQALPMPAPRTFSADARVGAERLTENARVAAAAAMERVQEFWKKRAP